MFLYTYCIRFSNFYKITPKIVDFYMRLCVHASDYTLEGNSSAHCVRLCAHKQWTQWYIYTQNILSDVSNLKASDFFFSRLLCLHSGLFERCIVLSSTETKYATRRPGILRTTSIEYSLTIINLYDLVVLRLGSALNKLSPLYKNTMSRRVGVS